ncbi:WD repeat-containing 88 [Brachionus plicatilis]|uniref:WD repeat-containing 88 n=1 Tax=Brachionus plicatilis TaxID=10195 RepID=A0A3M7SHM2_BRAPC|nr:WD repeat-containing 88 [Brachionus plicatilis]
MNQESALAPNAQWVHEKSAEVRIKQINGHKDSVSSCQLINNDQNIFTVSNDNTARIWNFNSGAELNTYKNLHEAIIPKARVSHDNSNWDKTVKCWDMETGQVLWTNSHEHLVTSCSYTNENDKYIVSASDVDHLVKLWDGRSGNLVMSIPNLHQSSITSCGFSPQNDRIVTTSMDKATKFFDITAKKITISLGSHTGVISNFAFTQDERKFVTCSWDRTLQVWDISTGMYRKNGPSTLSKAHEGSISSCVVSQDGLLCASAGYDTKLVLWDLLHYVPKLILRGHSNWLNDVAITKDNKWLVSVGKDRQIREWDITNCENIKLVIEQNKNFGNKLINCSTCNRPFTMAKLEKVGEFKLNCVFCRLQGRIFEAQLQSSSSSNLNYSRMRSSSLHNQSDSYVYPGQK